VSLSPSEEREQGNKVSQESEATATLAKPVRVSRTSLVLVFARPVRHTSAETILHPPPDRLPQYTVVLLRRPED
jgi:hypothetical protein